MITGLTVSFNIFSVRSDITENLTFVVFLLSIFIYPSASDWKEKDIINHGKYQFLLSWKFSFLLCHSIELVYCLFVKGSVKELLFLECLLFLKSALFYLKAITSVEHLVRPFHLTIKRAITYLHNVPAKEYKIYTKKIIKKYGNT